MNAWDKVLKARDHERPLPKDFMKEIIKGFIPQKGDRLYGEDGAVKGGIGFFKGQPVTVILISRGKDLEENLKCNFGSPNPEGYRKALRLMKAAEKFNRPVIMMIDTKGAGCAMEAEERGQGEAIAQCLYESSTLRVPMISFITGEGGSGGALALAAGDEVYMMENAIYSILSPEGFASILYKDPKYAKDASEIMKITADHLYEMKIIEGIIPEEGDINQNFQQVISHLENTIDDFITRSKAMEIDELIEKRYQRFRSFGQVKWHH